MFLSRSIDLNADLGEGCGDDAAMLAVVTSASIACGGHAGNVQTMTDTVAAAMAAGVRIGAHPGYPDRANFGRVSMDIPLDVLRRSLVDQLLALTEATREYNMDHPDRADADQSYVAYVKPHGALYHDAATNRQVANAICEIAWINGIMTVMGPAGSVLETVAAEHGMTFEAEGFADRMYEPDGTLTVRTRPGAVHATTKEVVDQAVHLGAYGYVLDSTGSVLTVRASTLCLHGDTPGAVEHAVAVQDALLVAGVNLAAANPTVRPAPVDVVPFGDTALLLTVPAASSPASVANLFTTGVHAHLFTEVIPGADTILLVLADPNLMAASTQVVTGLAANLGAHTPALDTGPVVRIPVTYDGADLLELAGHVGLSVDEVIAEHCRTIWTVDFLGFAPGFPYLSSPSALFNQPRRGTPRAVVPVGSIGVAAGQTCIYPSVSPGGWNLIGRTDTVLFNPSDTVRPALLAAGTRVQFHQVGAL